MPSTTLDATTAGLIDQRLKGTPDLLLEMPERHGLKQPALMLDDVRICRVSTEEAVIAPPLLSVYTSCGEHILSSRRTIYSSIKSPSTPRRLGIQRTASQDSEGPSPFTHKPIFNNYGELLPAPEWDSIPKAKLQRCNGEFESSSESGYSTPSLSWSPSDSMFTSGDSWPSESLTAGYFYVELNTEDFDCTKMREEPSEIIIDQIFKDVVRAEMLSH
jgi:hypothetical protein